MEGRENKKTCLARFQANRKTIVIKTVWYYHWRNQICQQNETESSEETHTRHKDLIRGRDGTKRWWESKSCSIFSV